MRSTQNRITSRYFTFCTQSRRRSRIELNFNWNANFHFFWVYGRWRKMYYIDFSNIIQFSAGPIWKGFYRLWCNLPKTKGRSAGSFQCTSQGHAATSTFQSTKGSSSKRSSWTYKTSWAPAYTSWGCVVNFTKVVCKNGWESVASDINNLLVLLKDGTCDYFVASFCFWSVITSPTSRSIFYQVIDLYLVLICVLVMSKAFHFFSL